MTQQTIIKKFEKKGYKISVSFSTGNVVVNKDFTKTFTSYAKAYNYYFKTQN